MILHTLSVTAGLVLLISGFIHVTTQRTLSEAISRQRSLFSHLPRATAAIISLTEITVGALSLTGALFWPQAMWPLLLAALLYATYTGYAVFLLRRRPDAPCGCSIQDSPASKLTVVRALVLGVASAFTAIVARTSVLDQAGHEIALAAMAAITFSIIALIVPIEHPERGEHYVS